MYRQKVNFNKTQRLISEIVALGRILVKKMQQGYLKILAKRQTPLTILNTAVEPEESVIETKVPRPVIRYKVPQPAIEYIVERQLPQRRESDLEITLKPPKSESESFSSGIEIPAFTHHVKLGKLATDEQRPVTKIIYPLIPSSPQKGEPIFAYAKIFWDAKSSGYVYQVVEPELKEKLSDVLIKIKELLEQRLDIDFSKLKLVEVSDYLSKQIEDLINYFKFKLSPAEKTILKYYIERDFIGLGKIEPLMRDKNIEDISCDGIGIPIFVYHRNPVLGSIATDITFENPEELDSFLTRLVQLCGKSVSVAQPLIDGSLPDGSRLQATLATDIARRGSNFTIRRFSDEPLTPIHLLNYGTIDARTLAYLWLAVDFGRSILISGGTASGKTSLLNVLSLFIRSEKKIISIEDTAELRLPHPHWVPTVARTPVSAEASKLGEVDMFDLLKESLRQRPDYIVVGEVRGREAYILFQQMATGHPSLATIHAENLSKLVDRLTTQPISLPKSLVGSLDIIVFLLRVRHKDKYVRKVNEILEMIKFDSDSTEPLVDQTFKWNPAVDVFEVTNKSIVLQKISDSTGVNPLELVDELERRSLVLDWMQQKNIIDYKSVHKIITMYYTYPKQLLAMIMGER